MLETCHHGHLSDPFIYCDISYVLSALYIYHHDSHLLLFYISLALCTCRFVPLPRPVHVIYFVSFGNLEFVVILYACM